MSPCWRAEPAAVVPLKSWARAVGSTEHEAIQKSGKGCLLGWYSSGKYCARRAKPSTPIPAPIRRPCLLGSVHSGCHPAPPNPGVIWLGRELQWSQNGRRVSAAGRTVVDPCEGAFWLGDLTLLNAAGDADVDPYAQYTLFTVLEFGASYGSGGIGGLSQPLICERVFGTLKPTLLPCRDLGTGSAVGHGKPQSSRAFSPKTKSCQPMASLLSREEPEFMHSLIRQRGLHSRPQLCQRSLWWVIGILVK